MLGIDFIRDNLGAVEKAIRDKGLSLDLDAVIATAAEVRHLKTKIDKLRAERNSISASFKDAPPAERAALGAKAKEAGAKAGEFEARLSEQEAAVGAATEAVVNLREKHFALHLRVVALQLLELPRSSCASKRLDVN